jgi:signal peptidase I
MPRLSGRPTISAALDAAPLPGSWPATVDRAVTDATDASETTSADEVEWAPRLDTAAEREAEENERVRSMVEWVAVIVGALVVALIVKTFLFQAFYIPSASMEPTLQKGDRVLVNKLSYDLHDVHRGDVVVFELPKDKVGSDGIKDLIKRVIGLPGDTIETRDGAVYINDRKLEEPYLAAGTQTGDTTNGNNPTIDRHVVPPGTVFVMGDNRGNSHDSRYADRGPIPINTIVGRAFILVWPPGKMGSL